jgi:hypothetical protein
MNGFENKEWGYKEQMAKNMENAQSGKVSKV